MVYYILKRLVFAVFTVWIIATTTFFLIRLVPGGPFDGDRPISKLAKQNIEKVYGLDRPLIYQYYKYIQNLIKLDLGPSLVSNYWDVNDKIFTNLKYSATIGMSAYCISLAICIALGCIAAINRGKWLDGASMLIAMGTHAIPTMVAGPLAIIIFAVYLGWLPAGGWGDGSIHQLALPVITLSVSYIAYKSKIVRNSLIDVLSSPYIVTARAKGLSRFQVIVKHAIIPALIPVITIIGMGISFVITGAFIIETVFSLPGLSRQIVDSAFTRDYPVITSAAVLTSTMLVIGNLCADLLVAFIDPRVRRKIKHD